MGNGNGNKLPNVWVAAQNASAIAELTAGAGLFGEHTALLYAGSRDLAAGVHTAYYLGDLDHKSYINYIPAIVALVKEKQPQLILFETTRNGRLAAAAVAAAIGVNVFTDPVALSLEGGYVVSKRMVYGGAAFKTEKSDAVTVVACVGAGQFEPGSAEAPREIIEVAAPAETVRLIEKRPKAGQTVNLAAAKNVIGVGRGLGKAENLTLVQALAEYLGAEIGCTRPVAEEEKWLPKEAYVGVSGVMLKPSVYLGVGVSGQIQHMVGVNQSRLVFAINKDKSAPIFKQCDYGMVADLSTAIPALTKKFSGS